MKHESPYPTFLFSTYDQTIRISAFDTPLTHTFSGEEKTSNTLLHMCVLKTVIQDFHFSFAFYRQKFGHCICLFTVMFQKKRDMMTLVSQRMLTKAHVCPFYSIFPPTENRISVSLLHWSYVLRRDRHVFHFSPTHTI